MIKVSKLADYAVVALTTMAEAKGQVTAPALARMAGLPEPTVAKVLKLLAGEGLVHSTRGVGGGYKLATDIAQISIADVITAIDGPIALTACVDAGDNSCGYQGSCSVRGRWDQVNMAVNDALKSVRLVDMTARTKSCASNEEDTQRVA